MAIRVRRTRRQGVGRYKLRQAPWFDPYPHIPGTEPEKRVFAMLVAMKIYFIYQGQVPEFEKGKPWFQLAPPNYKPDFVLPEYRLIIDPFSPFHHTLGEAIERDQNKVAAYAVAGYAYYHPWAIGPGLWTFDQYHNKSERIVTGTYRVQKYRKRKKKVPVDVTYTYKDPRTGKIVKTVKKREKRDAMVYVPAGYTEKENSVSLYQGVNAERNRYRRINRDIVGTKHDTYGMLRAIPEIVRGPLYKLTDPRDIKAKQSPGYRIGQYVGAGANSVAAANAARAGQPRLGIRYGTRRTIRRS